MRPESGFQHTLYLTKISVDKLQDILKNISIHKHEESYREIIKLYKPDISLRHGIYKYNVSGIIRLMIDFYHDSLTEEIITPTIETEEITF